jgi:hypothetical protein
MLAGCRRAAEAAGDAGERPRGSASASAVLPSAGGLGCEIAEPLDDPFGSFAGARSRRRRPRIIMWCPQRSRTTYSPPGQGWSSLFLQVSRGTLKSPYLALPSPPCRRSRPHWHHVLAAEGCRPPQGSLRDNQPCPVNIVSETTNSGCFTWNLGTAGVDLNLGRFTWNVAAAGVDLRRFGCSGPPPRCPVRAPSRAETRTMGAWRGCRAGADTERL